MRGAEETSARQLIYTYLNLLGYSHHRTEIVRGLIKAVHDEFGITLVEASVDIRPEKAE